MKGSFFTIRPLVLASGSPRRQSFLRDQGLDFQVLCAPDAEPGPLSGENPAHYALRAAQAKAFGARPLAAKNAVVLAADTIVVLDDKIFGKPRHAAHALEMLESMAGRTHEVITACCILMPEGEASFYDSTQVTFAPWPRQVLQAYVDSGEPMDKAGAYGMQGHGSFLVASLKGSWSTVVGLPLDKVLHTLIQHGVITPTLPAENTHEHARSCA